MNIHTELSPRVYHLINIQETLIDYNVFAGMCSLLMSAGWINVSCTVCLRYPAYSIRSGGTRSLPHTVCVW